MAKSIWTPAHRTRLRLFAELETAVVYRMPSPKSRARYSENAWTNSGLSCLTSRRGAGRCAHTFGHVAYNAVPSVLSSCVCPRQERLWWSSTSSSWRCTSSLHLPVAADHPERSRSTVFFFPLLPCLSFTLPPLLPSLSFRYFG